MAKAQCYKNCFTCPYEDCICDDLTYEDYRAEKEIDLLSGTKEYKTSPKERAYSKRYYEENKKRIAATRQEQRANNKEKISAYRREYREKNREKISAYQREYREKNRERLRIKRQEKRKENRSGRLQP